MKIWNEELLSYQDVKGYADPILKSIKKTTDYLSLLEKEQLAKGIPFGFPHYLGSDPHTEDKRRSRSYVDSISKSAEASRISLEELKTQIERQLQAWKSPPQRPTADSQSFIFDIAKRYYEYFQEMPTTYEDGIFYNVVAKALEYSNLPHADHRRKIRQAVEKLKLTKAH